MCVIILFDRKRNIKTAMIIEKNFQQLLKYTYALNSYHGSTKSYETSMALYWTPGSPFSMVENLLSSLIYDILIFTIIVTFIT